jgi:hypothetical protein
VSRRWCWPAAGLLLVGVIVALVVWAAGPRPWDLRPALASPTAEPIFPSPTPGGSRSASASEATPRGLRTAGPAVTPLAPLATILPGSPPGWTGRARFGCGLALGPAESFDLAALGAGWYVDWAARPDPARPGGMEYVQMVRLKGRILSPNPDALATIARSSPGSLWLIGNEPDVIWQDNARAIGAIAGRR